MVFHSTEQDSMLLSILWYSLEIDAQHIEEVTFLVRTYYIKLNLSQDKITAHSSGRGWYLVLPSQKISKAISFMQKEVEKMRPVVSNQGQSVPQGTFGDV